jgi:hypothetical protein
MPPLINYGFKLYCKNYHTLHQLTRATVYAKFPNYPNCDVPREIEHILEDFMRWFKYDDDKHLLYKWVASENHLAIIKGMDGAVELVNGEYVFRDREEYETPNAIAEMEELERALDAGEIGCTYKY